MYPSSPVARQRYSTAPTTIFRLPFWLRICISPRSAVLWEVRPRERFADLEDSSRYREQFRGLKLREKYRVHEDLPSAHPQKSTVAAIGEWIDWAAFGFEPCPDRIPNLPFLVAQVGAVDGNRVLRKGTL